MTTPTPGTESETWHADSDGELNWLQRGAERFWCDDAGADYLNRLEAEARAARLAVEALQELKNDAASSGQGLLRAQWVEAFCAMTLSAIDAMNQGGQR